MKDLTESEVQENWRIMVVCIPKVPLQGFSSVPAESVLALYCNIEVSYLLLKIIKPKTMITAAVKKIITLPVALSRPARNTSLPTGRQAKPCNAGLVDIE